MGYIPSETENLTVACHAYLACGTLPELAQRDGQLVFRFPTTTTADGKPLDVRFANLPPTPSLAHARRQLAERAEAFLAETHRKARQGAAAAPEPAYSRAELGRMSQADQMAEMPSINRAMQTRSVDGFTYPDPPPGPPPAVFTRSQLLRMSREESWARRAEIEQAYLDGAIDLKQ